MNVKKEREKPPGKTGGAGGGNATAGNETSSGAGGGQEAGCGSDSGPASDIGVASKKETSNLNKHKMNFKERGFGQSFC